MVTVEVSLARKRRRPSAAAATRPLKPGCLPTSRFAAASAMEDWYRSSTTRMGYVFTEDLLSAARMSSVAQGDHRSGQGLGNTDIRRRSDIVMRPCRPPNGPTAGRPAQPTRLTAEQGC